MAPTGEPRPTNADIDPYIEDGVYDECGYQLILVTAFRTLIANDSPPRNRGFFVARVIRALC